MEADCFRYDAVAWTRLNTGYTRSTSEPTALSLRVTAVGRVFSIKVPSMKTVTLSGDGVAKRNRRSRMGIAVVWSRMDDCSWEIFRE